MLFFILTQISAITETTKGAETRAAILDRAVDLASAEGLEGLTIGRLAAELEMSKSGIFAHFGSKQDLQLATVEAAAARFSAEVIEPAAAAPEAPPVCAPSPRHTWPISTAMPTRAAAFGRRPRPSTTTDPGRSERR